MRDATDARTSAFVPATNVCSAWVTTGTGGGDGDRVATFGG
jgi:hypothetical protein